MIRKTIFSAITLLINAALTFAQTPEKTDSLPDDLFYAQELFSAHSMFVLNSEERLLRYFGKGRKPNFIFLLDKRNLISDSLEMRPGIDNIIVIDRRTFALQGISGGELITVENGQFFRNRYTSLDHGIFPGREYNFGIAVHDNRKTLHPEHYYLFEYPSDKEVRRVFSCKSHPRLFGLDEAYIIPQLNFTYAVDNLYVKTHLRIRNVFLLTPLTGGKSIILKFSKVKGGWGYVKDKLTDRDFFVRKSEAGYELFLLNTSLTRLDYVNTLPFFPSQIYGNEYIYQSIIKVDKYFGRKKKKTKSVRSWHKRPLFKAEKKLSSVEVEKADF